MAQVTLKDLSAIIPIGQVEEQTRITWEQKYRRRRGLNQWIVSRMPWFIVLMLAVFYVLSAPHTASIMETITPFWGRFAPIGFEFGVLIVSALQEAGWKNRFTQSILLTLLGISIAINIGGGIESIIESSENTALKQLTLQGVIAALPSLPASSQVSLMLVFPVGFIIPIVSKFAGEVFIKFAMNKIILTTVSDEDMWLKERRKLLQQALYAEAVKLGAGAVTAGNWSQTMVLHWYREVREADTPADNRTADNSRHNGIVAQNGHHNLSEDVLNVHENPVSAMSAVASNASAPVNRRNRDARQIVRAYLEAHPEAATANVRELGARLEVSRTIVSEEQRKFRGDE